MESAQKFITQKAVAEIRKAAAIQANRAIVDLNWEFKPKSERRPIHHVAEQIRKYENSLKAVSSAQSENIV